MADRDFERQMDVYRVKFGCNVFNRDGGGPSYVYQRERITVVAHDGEQAIRIARKRLRQRRPEWPKRATVEGVKNIAVDVHGVGTHD